MKHPPSHTPQVILASQSPRRREILQNLGIPFCTVVSEADESADDSLAPESYAEIIAHRKAEAVKSKLLTAPLCPKPGAPALDVSGSLIIAADTIVVCEGNRLGKPKNEAEAAAMMHLLSGKRHAVISGIAVLYHNQSVTAHETTYVDFRRLEEAEIQAYIHTKEPYDKAGGYGIQDKAALFVRGIEGDYLNVVGLPVYRLFRVIKNAFDIPAFEMMLADSTR